MLSGFLGWWRGQCACACRVQTTRNLSAWWALVSSSHPLALIDDNNNHDDDDYDHDDEEQPRRTMSTLESPIKQTIPPPESHLAKPKQTVAGRKQTRHASNKLNN